MRCIPVLLLVACTSGAEPEPLRPLPADEQPVGEAQPMDAATLRARALEAYQQGDMERFVSLQEQALQADPGSTITRYNLACGYARTGRRDRALAELRTLLEAGVDYGAALDSDFASLTADPEFQQIVLELANLHPVVHHAQKVARISDRMDLAPEGIAVDPSSGRTYVSSMRTGTIWASDDPTTTDARPLATLTVDGVPVSAFGMELDRQRGVLWAVASAFSLHQSYQPSHQGRTAVIGLDPATGQVIKTHQPIEGPPAGFNDVAIGADGALYLTGGDLFVVAPGESLAVPLGLNPPLQSSNGITTSDDPSVIYVAANRSGIARVDLDDKTWAWVEAPAGLDLRNVDGLDFHEGSLLAVQLGMSRWRAMRLDLDDSGGSIAGHEILEQGHPEIAFVTTATVVGDRLQFVARAPLESGTDRASAGPADGATEIWSVPLDPE